MKNFRMKMRRQALLMLPVITVVLAGTAPNAMAQMTVFDPSNYEQNLLTAARALEQVNNQVRSLQNEADVLLRMDQNLSPLGSTISPDLQRTLTGIESELRAGQGIALSLGQTESGYDRMYPSAASAALSSDDALRNAKSRWDEDYAAFRCSAFVQGEIADSIDGDSRLLGDAMTRSRTAAGALHAAQAGNELSGLGVKQSLALESLLVAQHRAETLTRAKDLATEDEARQRFTTFVGEGSAYAASR